MKAATLAPIVTLLPCVAFAAEPAPFSAVDERPPECGTMAAFGEGLASALRTPAMVLTAIGSTLAPHLGYQQTVNSGALVLGWPLQLAFGTVTGEQVFERRCDDDLVDRFRAHRVVLEPQFIQYLQQPRENLAKAFGLRPAYRFVYHATDSKWGFGGGVAGDFQLVDGEWQPGVGGELIGQYGKCCFPGYLDLSLRYTKFFGAQEHAVALMFGFSYF